jgi:hypothetical protein
LTWYPNEVGNNTNQDTSSPQNCGQNRDADSLVSVNTITITLPEGFASKVVVAPKVGFLPQKSFRIVIPFADYDLPAAISELVCVPLGFT